jgi:F-box/leucine-rich repeat protein 10/11
MRRVTSFREQYRQATTRATTPPRPAYEPLSPVLSPTEPSIAHPASNANITTASIYGGGQPNDAQEDTLSLGQGARAGGAQSSPAVTYEESSRSANPPPQFSLARSSPIEALAEAAIISQHTGPAYVELARHASYPATSLTTVPYPISERAPSHVFSTDPTHSLNERPAKRARSEVHGSPQYGQSHARPATSHIPGWSYNVDQKMDSGNRMYQNTIEHSNKPNDRPNDQLSDAELLLNFFNVSTQTAQSPPSTAKRWSISQSAPAEQSSQQTQQTREPAEPYVAPLPPSEQHSQHTQPPVDVKHDPQQPPDAVETASAAQTHTPPEESSSAVPQPEMQEPVPAEEPKPKKHQGWPKGKPRGPRSNTTSTGKRKRSTPKPKSASSTSTSGGPDQLQSPLSLPAEQPTSAPAENAIPPAPLAEQAPSSTSQARRHSFSTSLLSVPNEATSWNYLRAQSAPLGPQTIPSAPTAISSLPTNAPLEPDLICAACNSTESDIKIGDGEQWIGCDGCKEWHHYPCAGFNSEREVREVNKFYCEPCRPKFGETTSRSTDAPWAYSSNIVQRFVNQSEPTPLLTTLV